MNNLRKIISLNVFKRSIVQFSRNLGTEIAPAVSRPVSLINNNNWIWQQNDKIKLPVISKIEINLPNRLRWVPPLDEPAVKESLEMPASVKTDTPKQAARLMIIRRKKMKKHKLKKLRKRMKFDVAKRRQRRELKKEKEFQAVLIQQCKEAEAFSAEKYVEEKLALYQKALEAASSNNHRKSGNFIRNKV